ncbi:hypothetical protein VTK26DRAFT_5640 [Humicola hyalothermophila]
MASTPTSARDPDTSGFIPIRLVTLNIRFAINNPAPGEERWPVRCPKLCAQLKFIASGQESPFVCLQEVLHPQLVDIREQLGQSWSYIGQGREDGKEGGEYCPIFFRSDRWVCEHSTTYWLSETPDRPSKGWDADNMRIVTVGSFRHRATGTAIVVMNTHLDYRGAVAREEGARLLLLLAKLWPGQQRPDDARPPLFLGGDFNSTPADSAYDILTSPGSGMRDISDLVPDNSKYGNPDTTYTSFGEPGERQRRIDFLFVRNPPGNLRFLTFSILSNRFDDGVYLSDHRPVVADLEIPVARTDD